MRALWHCAEAQHASCVVQDALVQVCGGEEMADRATKLWEDIKTKHRLDVSNQKLSDDSVVRLIKGLHMCDSCHARPRHPEPAGQARMNTALLSLTKNVGSSA